MPSTRKDENQTFSLRLVLFRQKTGSFQNVVSCRVLWQWTNILTNITNKTYVKPGSRFYMIQLQDFHCHYLPWLFSSANLSGLGVWVGWATLICFLTKFCGIMWYTAEITKSAKRYFFCNYSFSLVTSKNVAILHCSHCSGQNVLAALTPREQLKAAENTYLIGSYVSQPRWRFKSSWKSYSCAEGWCSSAVRPVSG